ncbi:MAG: hypothetical protein AAGJ79_00815 [Verrucomicrobiota bacterium]
MPSDRDIACRESQASLGYAERVLGQLKDCFEATGAPGFAMARRHAKELHLFLSGYYHRLDKQLAEVKEDRNASDSEVHLLAANRFEFEDAVRFVREAFIRPREISSPEGGILGAADRMCVEGYQLFLGHSEGVERDRAIGPLVALDSTRTPGVWKEDTRMGIPSVFEGTASQRGPNAAERTKTTFPVICLPSDLARAPEYLPLLSHEVGHAVDNALELSDEIMSALQNVEHVRYWKAWMREIVADAVGFTLSGDGFPLALWRYLQRGSLSNALTHSDPYPPATLRLLFLAQLTEAPGSMAAHFEGLPEIDSLPRRAGELQTEFENVLLPLLKSKILDVNEQLRDEQAVLRDAAARGGEERAMIIREQGLPLRQLASVFTLASGLASGRPNIDLYRSLVGQFKEPEWFNKGDTNWSFSENYIPALRPTMLGTDGRTKVPPTVLLATHQKIAFVGATQKWLLSKLVEVIGIRNKEATKRNEEPTAWEQMDFFFACDALLEKVEYYDKDGERCSVSSVIGMRDRGIRELQELVKANRKMVPNARFYLFDGPALFASYWDWDQLGGRVHISPQLLGTDISQCPATDLIRLHNPPNYAYERYCDHLDRLYETAEEI